LFGLILVIHIFVSFGLIISVLMQSAKGEGLAGALGGGALSGAVFGGRGASTFLSKATTVLAATYMITCILLTFTGGGTVVSNSALTGEAQKALEDVQVAPTQLPAQGGQQQGQGQQTAPIELTPPSAEEGSGQ
jgi:preprotein translocase subunit SecG